MNTIYNKRGESFTAIANIVGKKHVTLRISVKADALLLETPSATISGLTFSRHDIQGIIILLADAIDMECQLKELDPKLVMSRDLYALRAAAVTMIGVPDAHTVRVRMPAEG